MVFGERLKHLREGRYSQEDLAEKLNVHNNTISKWENGSQEPRAKNVAELARILGTTTAYLLGDTDSPEAELKPQKASIKEQTQEHNTNMATFTTKDGAHFEAPATPEGFAYLERMFAMVLSGREATQPVAMA